MEVSLRWKEIDMLNIVSEKQNKSVEIAVCSEDHSF